MNTDLTAAQALIETAMLALKNGDRRTAHHNAEQAAALAPQLEQPWLLLAYLASPNAASYYLDQALRINPTSQRALAAQEWLKKHSVEITQPAAPNSPGSLAPARQRQPVRTVRNLMRFAVLLLVLAILTGLAALSSPVPLAEKQAGTPVKVTLTVMNAGATLRSSLTPSRTWTTFPVYPGGTALTETLTASPTAGATTPPEGGTATASPAPTGTASPSPTASASPSPTPKASSTPTAKPTATHQPTATPVKNTNYTVRPGDTLSLIALRFNVSVQDLIAANNLANPSLLRSGQVLIIPNGSGGSQPTAVSNPTRISGKGKEIQIDISEQHIYAYQEGKLVFSFVASTGIGNSTRLGTFKVLDKIPRAYSNAFNIWMPYWMGIYYSGTLENGIHGLPLLWNGVELWGNLLGKPATYGCIESRTSEIHQLYDWAEIGTPVIIRQ